MAKSRVRGGKKAHNKKIEQRNRIVQSKQNEIQRLFNESMKAQIEEMRKKNEEGIDVDQNEEKNEMGLV
jgi:hypothetical protein